MSTTLSSISSSLRIHNLTMKASYNPRRDRWEATLFRGSRATYGYGSSLAVAVEHALAQVETLFAASV